MGQTQIGKQESNERNDFDKNGGKYMTQFSHENSPRNIIKNDIGVLSLNVCGPKNKV